MMSTLKKVAALVVAIVTVTLFFEATTVKAEAGPLPGKDPIMFDMVVKAEKAGLLHKEYAELKDFRPEAEATPVYCRRLLKRAAKANSLDPNRIVGKEASFEWLGKNAERVDVPRPEWLRNPELWHECLSNLELETKCLFPAEKEPTRIQVLYWTIVMFYPDIPVGYDLSNEALAAYQP